MKTALHSPIAQLLTAFGVIGAIYWVAQQPLPSFQALPINAISTATAPTPGADPRVLANLYALYAAAPPRKTPPPTPDDIIAVDDVFIPKTIPKETLAAKTPDYFNLLQSNNVLTLNAISDEGAIINQKFFSYGDILTDWAYPGTAGRDVAPLLRRAKKANCIQITERPGSRSFNLCATAYP
ncbi:hypothetical protein RHDC4_01569 [Rhodocyclaceae bacterium]|nr:hypothetical protein RHDC4_01569 [Rhodocyclaceae bacterium]